MSFLFLILHPGIIALQYQLVDALLMCLLSAYVMCICACVCIYICVHTYMHVCVCVCVHVYVKGIHPLSLLPHVLRQYATEPGAH